MYLLPLAKSMNVVTVIRLISRKGMLVWVTVIILVKSYHPLKKSPKVWGVQRKREKDRTFPQRVGLEWGIKTRWLILPWVHPRSRVNLRFSIMGAWFGQGPCYVKKDETFPLVFSWSVFSWSEVALENQYLLPEETYVYLWVTPASTGYP